MNDLISSEIIPVTIATNVITFFRNNSFASSNSNLIIKQILKLNYDEVKYLKLHVDAHAAMHEHLNKFMTLDFEWNDFMEDALEEIMDMRY